MTEQAAPQAAEAAVVLVQLVNTGRAPLQVLPHPTESLKFLTLLPNSQNVLEVPEALAKKLMRAYPAIKDAKSIFPVTVDMAKLQAEHAALKSKAASLEQLLAGADEAKAKIAAEAEAAVKALEQKVSELEDKISAAVPGAEAALSEAKAALEARVAELEAKLADFFSAENKKDLDAVKAKHAPEA